MAAQPVILIAFGSNIDGPWGNPRATIQRAVEALVKGDVSLQRLSRLIETAPFGDTDQPSFINAVATVETAKTADDLMQFLHDIERAAGRIRERRWGPRTLDLDLLDYKGIIRTALPHEASPLVLPHPGILERSFVLAPIAEIAPHWHHPMTGETAEQALQKLNS